MTAAVRRPTLGMPALGAAALGLALGVITTGAIAVASRTADRAPVAEPSAPSLSGRSYETFEGGSVRFGDSPGASEVSVVNFWSADCPPCVTELPVLSELSATYGSEVSFVGLTGDVDRDAALRLASAAGVTYPLGIDDGGDLFAAAGLFALPSTVILSADATVLDVIAGPVDAEQLADRIELARDRDTSTETRNNRGS